MPYVDICVQDHQSCPNDWPILDGYQNTEANFSVRIRNPDNTPYDLTCCKVLLQAKDAYFSTDFFVRKDVTISNPTEGIVAVSFTDKELYRSGLFLAELVVHKEADVPGASSSSSGCPANPELRLMYRIPLYIEVSPSLDLTSPMPNGISIAEVRLAIRDNCAEDNFLLDTTEFKSAEIAWALRRPVDYWNEALPPLGTNYSPMTFPYRYNYLEAVIGELLVMAALNYQRNHLSYAAGGVTVDDKAKAQGYMQAGEQRRQEYKKWVRLQKMSLNAGQAFMQTTIRSFGDRYQGRDY